MAHLVKDLELTPESLRACPGFESATNEILAALLEAGIRTQVPSHRMMCSPGQKRSAVPFVVSGRARVYTLGETGREITLYRLHPGETCILAISTVISNGETVAWVRTETDGEVLMIPAPIFRDWFDQVPFWRTYVLSQLSERLVGMIATTADAVFRRLDSRVAAYLLEAPARVGDTLRATHQDIAAELGSSREVVSRVLKSFEKDGLLRLGRGLIHLEDRGELAFRARPEEGVEMAQASGA